MLILSLLIIGHISQGAQQEIEGILKTEKFEVGLFSKEQF